MLLQNNGLKYAVTEQWSKLCCYRTMVQIIAVTEQWSKLLLLQNNGLYYCCQGTVLHIPVTEQ